MNSVKLPTEPNPDPLRTCAVVGSCSVNVRPSLDPSDMSSNAGEAAIKKEFLASLREEKIEPVISGKDGNGELELEPPEKRHRHDESKSSDSAKTSEKRHKPGGQNKHRPGPHKFRNDEKLCPLLWDGDPTVKCGSQNCHFMHDITTYIASKAPTLSGDCPTFQTYGKCSNGLSCVFAPSHTDENNQNVIIEDVWERMKVDYQQVHRNFLDRDVRNQLRKRQYDFKVVEKICSTLNSTQGPPMNNVGSDSKDGKPSGVITDEDSIAIRPSEVKTLDWNDKLYLSPLTTVGNLPFRRICVDFGADITCSEMSLATSLLQGNAHEFALLKRHPSEKMWGVQLCASNGIIAAKTAKLMSDLGVDYDFIDLNMGCPLEPIFVQGAGSGLMCRKNKFQTMVRSMTSYLGTVGKPFTVKMRTGIKIDKNFAHELIPFCRDNGVSMVTLHGRTKDQRYLKNANWEYIGDCRKLASPMPLFGNGDVLSWEDYVEKKKLADVAGVMIGRGALIKPWIFQEIKEQRHMDLTSSERLDIVRRYCHYGLDHWGSDRQGVETTRRFLLEWLSFTHRYIPLGILESPPQRINQRPPKYVGRDEMETLLGSPNAKDWIKISEMFLGPVPESFEFLPKHKANSWA